jgi:16S rRNA processing protein RimM
LIQEAERIRVARVVKPHGLDGALALEMLGGPPDRLVAGSTVTVDGAEFKVEEARPAGRGVLCRLAGVQDLAGATRLTGRYLEVPRDELRPLPEGEHFDFELIGLGVRDSHGEPRGTVVDVEAYPAHDVYVLRLGERELRIPAVRAAVKEIDLAAGTMTVADDYLQEWVDAV